uniref:Uncharacterized protein n=1 Tax=Kalanchoe fedtschenkoi TaxID=63787 RepID=A0A7N0THS1_KALFE
MRATSLENLELSPLVGEADPSNPAYAAAAYNHSGYESDELARAIAILNRCSLWFRSPPIQISPQRMMMGSAGETLSLAFRLCLLQGFEELLCYIISHISKILFHPSFQASIYRHLSSIKI